MNTISFKLETVIVPTVTRKLRVKWAPEFAQDLNAVNVYGEVKEEPHKILTVKEWKQMYDCFYKKLELTPQVLKDVFENI